MTERTPAAIGRALGYDEVEVDHLGHGLVALPAGIERIRIVGGDVANLDVTLEPKTMDRAAFDSRFGEGRPIPRVDYDRPFVLAYDVRVEGAPARCSVFARFDDEPTNPGVPASGVTLRIDP